jgi:LPXTG-motif cell wall-anchored protein
MRKRFSFLSGLAAVILFLFTFSTGALAADTTQSGTGTSATGTVQDTTYTDVQTTTYTDVPSSPSSNVTGSTYDVTGSTYDVTDSTYDVTDSTYQDVYFDWADVANTTPTDGNAVFDYTNNSNSGLILGTYLSSEDVAQVSHIVAKTDGVDVSYPVQVLPLNQYLVFSILKNTKVFENALSPVYDFSIDGFDPETFNDTFIKDFSQNPVSLTFKFDPKLLKNANDDIAVKYIDDNGNISSEAIEIVSVDKTTGVIVAKVKHFSSYGVFEVPSTTTTGTTSGTDTTGTTSGTDTTGTTSGTDTTGTTSGTDTTGTTSGTDTTGTTSGTDTSGTNTDVPGNTYTDVPGSTYTDVPGSTYQDVYQDVYFDWTDVANTTPTDGNAVFDYTNSSNSGLILDTDPLTSDSIAQVSHIVAKIGGVEVSYPVQVLPLNQYLEFSIIKNTKVFENALSPVYDFSIDAFDPETFNDTFIKDFSQNPVLLTLKFDPKLLKNANDDITVKYIDANGNISSEAIEIVSVDKTTGVIVAKVKHFSSYGVFEVASTTNTNNTGGTSTPGTTGGTSTTGTPTTSNTTTTTATPTTSSTTTTTATPTTSSTTTTAANSTLPNTATNSYNFLMAGLALVALGGILFSIRNRKSVN